MPAPATASLKVVWAALLGSMLIVLGVSVAMRPRLAQQDGLGVLTWMSVAWAVLSTVTAVFLRSVASEAEPGARRRGIEIASLATLESGALMAAVFHMVSPLDFGIYAAFLPLAAILAFFPRD
jgi:hypothetical protein